MTTTQKWLLIGIPIATILAVLTWQGSTFAARTAFRATQSVSIAGIINGNAEAQNQSWDRKGDVKTFNRKTYLKKIQKLDADFCPDDFKAAWIDYVQALELQEAKGLFGTVISGEANRLQEARLRVEKTAKLHGLKLIAAPN